MTTATKDRIATVSILLTAIIYAIFFCLISHFKYHNFEYTDFDLAIDSNGMWNILHGSFHSSIHGIPFFGNHMRLILVLLAPVYAIFRTPLFLLYLQSLALASAIPATYFFARKEIANRLVCVLLTLALAIYPPLINLNLYEFHPIAFVVPLLILAFLFYRQERFRLFLACLILALLCQENISLIAIGFGLYAWADRRTFLCRWTLAPAIIGIVYFVTIILIVMPALNPNIIQFHNLYSASADSFPAAIADLASHPVSSIQRAFQPDKLAFIGTLTAPLAFLSFLAPGNIVPVLPVLAQRLLSLRESEATIFFHYQAEFIPFVFVAAIFGIKRLRHKFPLIAGRLVIPLLIIFPALSWISHGFTEHLEGEIYRALHRTALDSRKESAIRMINKNDSVLATFEFLPKLSHRKNIYSLHHIYSGFHTLSDVAYSLPESPDCILVNTIDPLTFDANGFYGPNHHNNLRQLMDGKDWQVACNAETLMVLNQGKGSMPVNRLVQRVQRLPEINENIIQSGFADFVRLRGFRISEPNKRGVSQLSLYWENISGHKLPDFKVYIEITLKDRIYKTILTPGNRIYPPQTWPIKGFSKSAHGLIGVKRDELQKDLILKAKLSFSYKSLETH